MRVFQIGLIFLIIGIVGYVGTTNYLINYYQIVPIGQEENVQMFARTFPTEFFQLESVALIGLGGVLIIYPKIIKRKSYFILQHFPKNNFKSI